MLQNGHAIKRKDLGVINVEAGGPKISDVLTRDELRRFSKANNVRALSTLMLNWGVIVGAFALAIALPNPITILLAIVLLGGRQLGLGVIMHDCAHHAFFANKLANDTVGHWLCGGPINASVYAYRDYHLKHHRFAGTADDPDRWFVAKYPVEKASLRRKLMRDLTGRTGVRDLLVSLKTFSLRKNAPWISFHLVLIGVLSTLGALWAYSLWWIAFLCVYPALTRIRQIGEHGVAINRDSLNPRENTSTTLASWWERIFISPNNVGFHLEHHQFASVPPYNLPKLHALLKSRGYYDRHQCISNGYLDVLRRAVRTDEVAIAA